MIDKHYLYGRARLHGAAPFFLGASDGGGAGRVDPETGDVDFVLKVYAENRAQAQGIINTARAMSIEFGALSDDLERYIDCYDFSKPVGKPQPACEEQVGGVGARGETQQLPEAR